VALNEDLPETITTFRYYSGWADKIFGQTIGTTHQKFAYTLRQPIGVVAQIIPVELCKCQWRHLKADIERSLT
jgi:aldehyde dehydrogenase (NAD+)